MNSQPVLLVDDDDNDVLFLQNAWKKAAIPNALTVVTDGQRAIDYLDGLRKLRPQAAQAAQMPSFVLLDLNLPLVTGFEVLQWIRRHSEFQTLVIVILTASSSESDVRRAYLLGANSYIVKPSNPEQLRELAGLLASYWLGWNLAPAKSAED